MFDNLNNDMIYEIIQWSKWASYFKYERILFRIVEEIDISEDNTSYIDELINNTINFLKRAPQTLEAFWNSDDLIVRCNQYLFLLNEKKQKGNDIDELKIIKKIDKLIKLIIITKVPQKFNKIKHQLVNSLFFISELTKDKYNHAKKIVDQFFENANSSNIENKNDFIEWPTYQPKRIILKERTENIILFQLLFRYSMINKILEEINSGKDLMMNLCNLNDFNEMTIPQENFIMKLIQSSETSNLDFDEEDKLEAKHILNSYTILNLWNASNSFITDSQNICDIINNYMHRSPCDENEILFFNQVTSDLSPDFNLIIPTFEPIDLVYLIVFKKLNHGRIKKGPLFSGYINNQFYNGMMHLFEEKYNSFQEAAKKIGEMIYRTITSCKEPPREYNELKKAFNNFIFVKTDFNEFKIVKKMQQIFAIAESLDKWNNKHLVFDDIKFLSEDCLENDEQLNRFPSLISWINENKHIVDILKCRYKQYSPNDNKNEIPLWLLALRVFSSKGCIEFQKKKTGTIETDHCIYYSGRPYHFECVICSKCNKLFNSNDICISAELLLCTKHYNEHNQKNYENFVSLLASSTTNQKIKIEYNQKYRHPMKSSSPQKKCNFSSDEYSLEEDSETQKYHDPIMTNFSPPKKFNFSSDEYSLEEDSETQKYEYPPELGIGLANLGIEKKKKLISSPADKSPKEIDQIIRYQDQDPSKYPNFTEISDALESSILNNDSIDKNLFSEHKEKNKTKLPNALSKSDEQKLPQNSDSAQIECSVCLKKFNDKKEVIYVEDEVFMCREDFDRFVRLNELPPKFVDDYCNKIIDKTFSLFVSSTSIDSCRKEDIFIDSEMLCDSFHLNENFKYFCPTVTFHFERSMNEFDFKKIIGTLPDCMSITHIRKGSTFIVIAFVASEDGQITDESCRKMIEEIKEKLNPPMKEPLVGNYEEPTFKVPDDNDIKMFFQKKSVNIFQSPEILDLIKCEYVKEKVNEMLKKQKIEDKNLGFIFDHFDLFESSEEKVREDIEKSKYEFIVTGETIIANKFFNEYEKIKESISERENESSECFLYHGSPLKNHFGIVGEHFHEPGVDNDIDDHYNDPGFFGVGIYATDDIFYAAMYSNNRYVLKFNGMASVICCRAIYNNEHVSIIKPTTRRRKSFSLPLFGVKMDHEIIDNYGIHKVLVGDMTGFRPIRENDIEMNLIAAYEYVFPNPCQIIPISSFTIKRTDHFMIWIDDCVEDNHEILEEIRKIVDVNIYVKNSVSECIKLIEKKKENSMKIIVNVKEKETNDKIINAINDIKGIKCVFMIYSKDRSLTELLSNRENVLYADHSSHIIKFAKCRMKIGKIKRLAEELMKKYNIQMSINLKEVSEESDPLIKLTYPDQ